MEFSLIFEGYGCLGEAGHESLPCHNVWTELYVRDFLRRDMPIEAVVDLETMPGGATRIT